MDIMNMLKKHADMVNAKRMATINNEESTKMFLIVPFFSNILGYDTSDPMEFSPEYPAAYATNMNARADYVILKDKKPIMVIEAKPCNFELSQFSGQLSKYYNALPSARFGIITNGIRYQFYADTQNGNLMDGEPFFEFDLLNYSDDQADELMKFSKANFDAEIIIGAKSNFKYIAGIKSVLSQDLRNPSPEYTRYIMSKVYQQKQTTKAIEMFTPLLKRALKEFKNESIIDDDSGPKPSGGKEIITTEEEMACYYLIKYLLYDDLGTERLTYKDTMSYFTLMLNGNSRCWVCRIWIEDEKKRLGIRDAKDSLKTYEINTPEDIFKFQTKLRQALKLVQGFLKKR